MRPPAVVERTTSADAQEASPQSARYGGGSVSASLLQGSQSISAPHTGADSGGFGQGYQSVDSNHVQGADLSGQTVATSTTGGVGSSPDAVGTFPVPVLTVGMRSTPTYVVEASRDYIGMAFDIAQDWTRTVMSVRAQVIDWVSSKEGISTILDVAPIAGSVKSVVQVVTGHDMVTKVPVNRWAEGAGIVAGLIPGGKAATKGIVNGAEAVAARRAVLNEKFGRTGSLNYDINLRSYLEKVDSLDVSSRPGQAVFYSGWNPSGVSNRELGEAFARERGWTTLEQTPGGKWLDQEKLYGSSKRGDFLEPADADRVWAKLSQKYAYGSEKSVTAFVNGAAQDRVFYKYEYPILKSRGINIDYRDG